MKPNTWRVSAAPAGKTGTSCATPATAILSSSPTTRAISGSFYVAQPLHAGLIILIPVVSRDVQRRLFKAALDELAVIGEPVNRALEVDLDGDEVTLTALRLATGTVITPASCVPQFNMYETAVRPLRHHPGVNHARGFRVNTSPREGGGSGKSAD